MILVLDSSPLITLSTTNQLSLLPGLAQQAIIPSEVYHEIVTSGKNKPGALSVQKADWLTKKTAKNTAIIDRLAQRLGRGESETIALAKELPGSIVVLDDALARRMAQREGCKVIGTLGLLIHAKNRGLLSSIKPILQDLQDAGFYLDQTLIGLVLRKTGELP